MFNTKFIEREQIEIIDAYDQNENNAIYDHFVKQQFIQASTCFATYLHKYVVKICETDGQ